MIENNYLNFCPRTKMPYIAYNGELYDDEEIFNIENDEIDETEDYNYLPVDDVVMIWEKRMNV